MNRPQSRLPLAGHAESSNRYDPARSPPLISRTPLPAPLLEDLCRVLAYHIYEGDGPLVDARAIRQQLGRCDDAGALKELERFVTNVDVQFSRILEESDRDEVAEARRELAISLHPVQVGSKLWLIDQLVGRVELAGASVFVLGGWYGILLLLINWRAEVPPAEMTCIDIDARACAAGARMVGSLFENIQFRCADIMTLAYDGAAHMRRIVINTICEHLPDVGAWLRLLPKGELVALQSNNLESCPDHVSCVHSIEEFAQQAPLREVLFQGTLHFPELDRFMLIGYT